jgi:nucleoid-associated protein YgaU
LMIVSRLSDGPVLPAREAARLKNENLELKQRLTELRQQGPNVRGAVQQAAAPAPPMVPAATPALVVAATPTPPPTPVPAPVAPGEPEVRRAVPVAAALPAGAGSVPAATAVVPAAGDQTAGEAPVRTYKVQSGDTLAGIARKFYRNSGQWPKIAEANKATLEDPTKLKPGMILVIPQ